MPIRVRLQELLAKRGMAETELQARTGLGYSTINALCHEETERVECATLDKLCQALESGAGDLIQHVPPGPRRDGRTGTRGV